MIVSILALSFIILVAAMAVFGFRFIIKQGRPVDEINKERCSICRTQLHSSQLIERKVGDYRVYYFCPQCIENLHRELVGKN